MTYWLFKYYVFIIVIYCENDREVVFFTCAVLSVITCAGQRPILIHHYTPGCSYWKRVMHYTKELLLYVLE